MTASATPLPTDVHPVLAGQLDQRGKAVYGVPGPGAYDVPRAFRNWGNDRKPVLDRKYCKRYSRKESYATTAASDAVPYPAASDQTGTQGTVYPDAPAFSIGKRTALLDAASRSPGPLAYAPSYNTQLKAGDRACFGTANRDQQAKVFISRSHANQQIPADSPGPGTYRANFSPKLSNTMGSGPTAKFGTSPQRPSPGDGSASNTGAAYKIPSTMGQGPGVKLAAHGELERGHLRNREEAMRVFISPQHGQAENYHARSTPAPNQYKIPPTDMESRKAASPQHMFSKRERFGNASKKEYLGPLHTVEQMGKDSPDNLGTASTTFNHNVGPRFSQGGDRFQSPDKGGALYMGKLASMAMLGTTSAGPIYDVENNRHDAPAFSFGSSSREVKSKALGADGPGPGAYNPNNANTSLLQGSPAYSVASNLRSGFTATEQMLTPGPGAYNTENYAALKPKQSATRFGSADRYYSPDQKEREALPGPGCYDNKPNTSPSPSRGYSFGLKEARKADGKAIASVRYHGPLASSEWMGIDSPGPAAYGTPAYHRLSRSADAASIKFDKADRAHNAKLFISKLHASSSLAVEGPGPGAYNVKEHGVKGFTNKFKNTGAFSFGSGARMGLAKVTF